MNEPRKVAKPARGELNREIKCLCKCIRGKYVCTAVCICLHTRHTFNWVHVHSCTVHCCIEAHINWSMVTCQGSTRSELP